MKGGLIRIVSIRLSYYLLAVYWIIVNNQSNSDKVRKENAMKKKMLGLVCSGLIMGLMTVPAMADDEISVTVSVYDYAAVEAGIEGASQEGVIIDKYEVKVPAGTTDKEVVIKAFEDNSIAFEADTSYGFYVSSINGLAGYSNPDAVPDYSGWMLEYNGDGFTNWGIGYLGANGDGVVADGDVIEFDYSLYMGADLGTQSAPILNEVKIGDKTVELCKKLVKYDDTTYAPVFDYLVDGEAIKGTGTEEDPFVIEVELGKVADKNIAVSASASKYYTISGLAESSDFAKPMVVTVESKYGQKSYVSINAIYEAAETGDASALPLLAVCVLAMGAMLVSKKERA